MANLTEFINAAKIMATAAEQVAKDFDAVDVRSAEGSARVNSILKTATDQARAAREEAQRRALPPGHDGGPMPI
jgi:hypothetical protein